MTYVLFWQLFLAISIMMVNPVYASAAQPNSEKIVLICDLERKICYYLERCPDNPNGYKAYKIEDMGTPRQRRIKFNGWMAKAMLNEYKLVKNHPASIFAHRQSEAQRVYEEYNARKMVQ